MQLYNKYFKRPLDFLVALIAIIVLSPIFLLLALLIRMNLGSPIIFKQQRPGLNEQIFTLYKFRTMNNERDSSGELLPDNERLTKFGKLLRSTSLDELPELFNILKGEMSFVGPRPLIVKYLPYYTDEERLRHSVRPGLTGLAQVNGRNIVFWLERFRFDLNYVHNITFLGDIKIIIKTILVVLKRSDIGEVGVDAPIDFDQYRKSELSAKIDSSQNYLT